MTRAGGQERERFEEAGGGEKEASRGKTVKGRRTG